MMHPDTKYKFINNEKGYGVVAAKFIPKGTILYALCDLDRLFSLPEIKKISQASLKFLTKYAYIDRYGNSILNWDHGRFVNHSCEPNMLEIPDTDLSIAIRDIDANEEITCEYAICNLLHLFENKQCICKSKSCRKTLFADDIITYNDHLHHLLGPALDFVNQVPQPLNHYIKSDWLNAIANRTIPASSFKDFFYCSPKIKEKIPQAY